MDHTSINALDLQRRVAALERKMIEVASNAQMAVDSERQRVRARHDFWWNAFRAVAIAQWFVAFVLLAYQLR